MSENKLRDFLSNGKDWERMKTSIPGVFVQKLPAYKSSPSRLVIEINPLDSAGAPSKRRGFIIRSIEELEQIRRIFQDDKLDKLQNILESVNPKIKGSTSMKSEDVLEL
ncbi:hypothetical protein KEJ47_08855 [Candidatus Bathyarchaeota archaeon]|nr:hypothetical protein [Candidatus Bathyarchaeota archaeon]